MARYLITWTSNPAFSWPTDPAEALKLNEMLFAAVDDLMKKGEITDAGWFLNGASGYVIGEGDGATQLKNSSRFTNFFNVTVQEAIPYEAGKQVFRASLKAAIEAT
jgi:hypothetical protein